MDLGTHVPLVAYRQFGKPDVGMARRPADAWHEGALHIGIDIDDTIARQPSFFAHLASCPCAAGHLVTIVSSRTETIH